MIEEWKEYSEKLRLALKYIVDHESFIGKPKWDAEFVDVAKEALMLNVPGVKDE